MGRNTNVPFSILISARLPLLTLSASATAFGMRTARLLPQRQNSTIMLALRKRRYDVYTVVRCGRQQVGASGGEVVGHRRILTRDIVVKHPGGNRRGFGHRPDRR